MNDYCALLDNNYEPDAASYLFLDPLEFITVHALDKIPDAFEALEQARSKGHYAAGFVTYELAQTFGLQTKARAGDDLPYMQFGIFKTRQELGSRDVDQFLHKRSNGNEGFLLPPDHQITPEAYDEAIQTIKENLEAGNSYQVNFTFELLMRLGGCPYDLYAKLRQAQPVRYGALLNFPSGTTLSRSPELFFEKHGTKITTRPMKGTEPRAKENAVLDNINHWRLIASEKQRAENLMIVDLLRNDLSRISEVGSVEVEKLFDVETYETVHQMTSTISSRVDQDIDFRKILEALFPCGSVTGAPKHMTMQIIDQIEPHARGIYCGAIGMITPENDMTFSVPIRSLQLANGVGRFHVGGGIVYDSVDQGEYEEALLKGRFLFDLEVGFEIIESFYFSPDRGARNEFEHLERAKRTARALGFVYDERSIRDALNDVYAKTDFPAKIRILISQHGEVQTEAVPIDSFEGEKRVCVSPHRTDSKDLIYQHKTTNRALYHSEFKRARADGCYEVLFANEDGHLSEGAIHNLVLRFGDQYRTPPLSAGVLPGVGRAKFLQETPNAREENLPISALEKADEILLISSVRGIVPVKLAK